MSALACSQKKLKDPRSSYSMTSSIEAGGSATVGVGSSTGNGVEVGNEAGVTVAASSVGAEAGLGAHPAINTETIKSVANILFTGNPRPFYGFNKPFLQNEVHHQQRQNV